MMDSFGCFPTKINEIFRISFFLTGGLNGRVRFDLVFSFVFSSFVYPDLWKFDKNEKLNPSIVNLAPRCGFIRGRKRIFKLTVQFH